MGQCLSGVQYVYIWVSLLTLKRGSVCLGRGTHRTRGRCRKISKREHASFTEIGKCHGSMLYWFLYCPSHGYQATFACYFIFRTELGGLGSGKTAPSPAALMICGCCCPGCLLNSVPAPVSWEPSPAQLLLPFCGFLTCHLFWSTCCLWYGGLLHTPPWYLLAGCPAVGQDWDPVAMCQRSQDTPGLPWLVPVTRHLRLAKGWLVEAVGCCG